MTAEKFSIMTKHCYIYCQGERPF